MKTWKQFSCLKPQTIEPWYLYVISPNWPVRSLFKLWPWGQNGSGHVLFRENLKKRWSCLKSEGWEIVLLCVYLYNVTSEIHNNADISYDPVHEILVLITYANSQGSCKPVHVRSFAIAFAYHMQKEWKWKKTQTKLKTSIFVGYVSYGHILEAFVHLW